MKRKSVFILKGNIVYSKNQKEFSICENGYVVCKDGIVEGVYKTLPFKFGGNPNGSKRIRFRRNRSFVI